MELLKRSTAWAGPVIAVAAITGLWAMSTSAGALAQVPEVAGLRLEAAQRVLADSGFGVRVVLEPGPGVAGTVLGTTPEAEELLRRGSSIELRVTEGARQVGVPDVRGMPVGEAIRLIAEAELTPGVVTYVEAPGTEPNRVTSTDPPPGASVDAGTSVDVRAATP